MKHGIELAAREPAREIGRRDEIGQAALLQVPPLAVGAEEVADGDIAMPGLVQRRHQVRSDEAGSAGNQEHAQRAPKPPQDRPSGRPLLCPSRPGAATPGAGVDGGGVRRSIRTVGAILSRRPKALKENVNRPGGELPILIVPYIWIGDFVRCHTVVRLLKERFPHRPVDVLTSAMVAPLLDYMPGVRKGIVFDLPRKRLAWSLHRELADVLRGEGYGDALIMPRTWKSALAPALARIPVRTGFLGEMRVGLVNDLRPGEKALPAHGRPLRGAGAPQGRRPPRRLAAAAARGAGGRGAAVARADGARRHRAGGGGGARRRRPLEAMGRITLSSCVISARVATRSG